MSKPDTALPKLSKVEYLAAVPALRERLLDVQEELASSGLGALILVDGDPTTCDEVYQLLHEWFDARYLRAEAYGPANEWELQRPWAWRYWWSMPPRGSVGVFMRSWNVAAIIARVREQIDDDGLRRRIGHIRRLEESLVGEGIVVIKLWLRVPFRVLRKRVARAERKGAWHAKAEEKTLVESWGEVWPLAKHLMRETDVPFAPWHLIDGHDRRRRNLRVAETIADRLREAIDRRQTIAATPEPPPERLRTDPHTLLDSVDLGLTLTRDDYEAELTALQDELLKLHRRAHRRGVPLALAFEGWDAAGKGGAIRRVTQSLDATRYKVFPIAAPDGREKSRHWLWRFWRHVPRGGRVAIFDRSWYGRVLVERVEGYATRSQWSHAYAEIEDFEAQLVEHGIAVAKFWIHISKDEQLRRFELRKETGYKRHKITDEDWRNRERWADYEAAVEDMLAHTSGPVRWTVVPGNDKLHARIAVLRGVVAALRGGS